MRIGWRKWFVASIFSGLALLPACTVEVSSTPGTAGSGGSGGSAGTAGTGGAAGDAGTRDGATDVTSDAPAVDGTSDDAAGDTASIDAAPDSPAADGSTAPDASPDQVDATTADISADSAPPDGAIVDVSPDAGGACFAEDPPDASNANDCTVLPYFGVLCRDDAGADFPPAGATLCTSLDTDLKGTAFQELIACLKALPGGDGGMDACSSAHEQGAADCSRAIFNRSMCPVPEGVVDGGLYGCAQIAASCGPDSGDGGISVEQCQAWLGPFNAAARQGMIDCYLGPDPGASSCRDKFENYCVFN